MPIRRIDEQNKVGDEAQGIHEEGYPRNDTESKPEGVQHSQYGLEAAAKAKLRTIAANIVDCEDRAKDIAEEKKAFFAEAKAAGFDQKALKGAMAFLKDEAGRTEQEQLRDLYVEALRERAE